MHLVGFTHQGHHTVGRCQPPVWDERITERLEGADRCDKLLVDDAHDALQNCSRGREPTPAEPAVQRWKLGLPTGREQGTVQKWYRALKQGGVELT